ncbi:MAG: hypothetical protein QG673_2250 [Pseudomonadota bacterium]|jgi:hypothetical protein|nr:hypothetical protein [Pseudomonadota bacterium]
MRQSLLVKNKDLIVERLKQKHVFKHSELHMLVEDLKTKKLIPQSKSFSAIYEFFIDIGLIVHILKLNDRVIERYSMQKHVDVYQLANSLKPKSFFSMTTALNLQGYLDVRNNYVFVSSELTPKCVEKTELTQESIDEAYKKPYRMTKNYGEFEDNYIILLSPKNTALVEVIKFNDYMVSSINRAFVEIVVNMQYFKSSLMVVQLFKPLKLQLDLRCIFIVIQQFGFIYPFYQLFGYILEQIGFDKSELNIFKAEVNKFKFYTDKNQVDYLYDDYWQVFYIN